jgi:hypothetical protein
MPYKMRIFLLGNLGRHRTGNSIWGLLHSVARMLEFWVQIPLKLIEVYPRLFSVSSVGTELATGRYSIRELVTYISE